MSWSRVPPKELLKVCDIIVSSHAVRRYYQRVHQGTKLELRAIIEKDIRAGKRLKGGGLSAWRKNLAFLSDVHNNGSGCAVESADKMRLYICRWSSAGLNVCTVLVWNIEEPPAERTSPMSKDTMPPLVRQRGGKTCGQACVAMLLGITLDEAISRIGHDGITEDIEIAFAVGTDSPFVEGPPASDVVAIQKHRDPNGSREHWTVSWRGTTLDPACIGKRLWPVVKHAKIDWWN